MMDVLAAELLEYVHHGHEERNLEYKGILGLRSKEEKAKLAKQIMAMSNIRDGGVIIIGVNKDGTPVGISKQLAATFTQDAVASAIADYISPYAEITVTAGHDGGTPQRHFVVIQVKEFADIAVLCKQDYPGETRRGAVYVRSRRMYEATEIRTEVDMRELLEMAVDKGMRSSYRRLQAWGIRLVPAPSDSSLFETQLRGL